jgi:hypothetical protein
MPPAIGAAKLQLLATVCEGSISPDSMDPGGNGALKQDLMEADAWPNLGGPRKAVKCYL